MTSVESQGFASEEHMRQVFTDTKMFLLEYGSFRNLPAEPEAFEMKVRGEAIHKIVPEEAGQLDIGSVFHLEYELDNEPGRDPGRPLVPTTWYAWKIADPESAFTDRSLRISSPDPQNNKTWSSHRDDTLKPPPERISPFERLKSHFEALKLQNAMGTERMLAYEAAAIGGIIRALSRLDAGSLADIRASEE